MARLTLMFFWVLFAGSTFAQANYKSQNRWLSLIEYAGLNYQKIKSAAPHFPKIKVASESENAAFEQKLNQWKAKYTKEVNAFLTLPEIKKLNPALAHLGLQQNAQATKFENSYWQWITASGLSTSTLKSIAPHLPIPNLSSTNIPLAEKNYIWSFQDWMLLFPNEATQLFNQAEMKAHTVLKEDIQLQKIDGENAYLYVKVSEVRPERIAFNSGNEELDALRYSTYLKAWYHKFHEEEFYKIYQPEKYAEWKKNQADPENHKH